MNIFSGNKTTKVLLFIRWISWKIATALVYCYGWFREGVCFLTTCTLEIALYLKIPLNFESVWKTKWKFKVTLNIARILISSLSTICDKYTKNPYAQLKTAAFIYFKQRILSHANMFYFISYSIHFQVEPWF